MKGDFSRRTFRPGQHFTGVMLQQGRVALDSDFNEHVEAQAHRLELHSLDAIGPQGTPWDGTHGGGFQVRLEGQSLKIDPGRYYVQGMLCQNDDVLGYADQPNEGLPALGGQYLVYLEAWPRVVTALTHPELKEPALGGNDSAARLMVSWQVRMERVGEVGDVLTPSDFPPGWRPASTQSSATLKVTLGAEPQENRLYRVEVHKGGDRASATIKWSRENGAAGSPLLGMKVQGDTLRLTLGGNRRDSWGAITPGDWIELHNEELELQHLPGTFLRVDEVQGDDLLVRVGGVGELSNFDSDPAWHTPWLGVDSSGVATIGTRAVVRRWDMAWDPDSASIGSLAAGEDDPIELEGKLSAQLGGEEWVTGDHWLIPVRAGHGLLDWASGEVRPSEGPPRVCARLAMVTIQIVFDVPTVTQVVDWRDTFPTLGSLTSSVGTVVTGSGDVDRLAVWRQDGTTPDGAPVWRLEASPLSQDSQGLKVGEDGQAVDTTLYGALRFGAGAPVDAIQAAALSSAASPSTTLPTVAAVRDYVDTKLPAGAEGRVARWGAPGVLTTGAAFDSGARLAVGTVTPEAAVHAQANAASEIGLIVRGELNSGTVNLQEWQAPGVTVAAMDRQGRLGLGTRSPQDRIHIAAGGRLRIDLSGSSSVAGVNNDLSATIPPGTLMFPTDAAVKTYVDRRTLPGVVRVSSLATSGGADASPLVENGTLPPGTVGGSVTSGHLALGLAVYVQSTSLGAGAQLPWVAQLYVEADYFPTGAVGSAIQAYRAIHLQAAVSLGAADGQGVSRLQWLPSSAAVTWLNSLSSANDPNRSNRYLARLVVHGDTLWPSLRPGLWEMWFWLGTGALMTLSATTLTFDSKKTDTTNTATLTVTNPGSSTLTVAVTLPASPANFTFVQVQVNGVTVAGPTYPSVAVPIGQAMTVQLRCTQSVAEVTSRLTSTLTLTPASGPSVQTVSLIKPAEPALGATPTSLTGFDASNTSTQTFSVTNSGGAGSTLSVTNITSSNAHFSASPTSFSLGSGASQTVTVTCTVGQGENIQAIPATLTLVSNAYGTVPTISCSKPGLPAIGVSPSPLNTFDPAADSTRSVTVSNPGATSLSVSSITSSSGRFVPALSSLSVPAGGTTTLNIFCDVQSGDAVQTVTGVITLNNNASSGNNATNAYALTVTKPATAAALSASTSSLGFTAGATSSQSFTISNTGGGTISIATSWSSGASSYFLFTQAPPSTLGAGASATVTVQCVVTGSTAWTKLTHSLTINGGAAGTRTISLNKAGQPAIDLSTTTLTFDDNTNSSRQVTVTNVGGEGNLASSSLTLSDTVRFAVSPPSFNLTPGSSQILTVSSTLQSGDASQNLSRTLTISTNGVNTSYNATPGRAIVSLEKPATPAVLSRTPASLGFSTTTTSTRNVTITNTGGGTLSLGYGFSGTDASRFSLDSGAPSSLNAGTSGTATVRCTVNSTTKYSDFFASLNITSNGGSASVTLTKDAYVDPDPQCFTGDARVLMADGSARPISELREGDELLAVHEGDLLRGEFPHPRPARVVEVHRHDQGARVFNVGGLLATGEHPFATPQGTKVAFVALRELSDGAKVVIFDGRECKQGVLPAVLDGGDAPVTWNLTTTARTYLVASAAGGPWYLVHNVKNDPVEP